MDATDYWLFAREYSIWNAAVAALQFWMADLDPQTLSNAMEQVYTAFFCSNCPASKKHIRRNITQSFVEVDFLWNRTVDSLKTSFHLLL